MPVDNIEEHENFLVTHLAVAACLHHDSCKEMIDQKVATELGHVRTQRVEMVVFSLRPSVCSNRNHGLRYAGIF